MTPGESDMDGTMTPDYHHPDHPLSLSLNKPLMGVSKSGVPTEKLAKTRLKGKDYKKGGDGLRGKNVLEGPRVKEKDMKRTMK